MNPLIQDFNNFQRSNQTLIFKALTDATNVGNALVPEDLEQIVTDTCQRLSPELNLLVTKKIASDSHKFNQIYALPGMSGSMGEGATTPVTQSGFARNTVSLKIVRRKSKITKFLQDAASGYIDAQAIEIQNHLRSHVNELIYFNYNGNKDANAYEFDGIYKMIPAQNITNEVVGGAVPVSLSFLDDMIDASDIKGGMNHRRALIMHPTMISKCSRLLTNVRVNQPIDGSGLSKVYIGGGWRLLAYRDIPMIPSTMMKPVQALDQSITVTLPNGPTITSAPTVTLSSGGTTGGYLSNGTYYVQVSALTFEGETLACAEQPITLSGGTSTQWISVVLSAVPIDPVSGNTNAMGYRIYVAGGSAGTNSLQNTTTGTEKLLKIVSGFIYDGTGTVTASNGLAANPITITTMTSGADVPISMQSDVPYNSTGSVNPQTVVLWDFHPQQGLGKLPYTNTAGSAFEGLVTVEPIAPQDDYYQSLFKSYCALTPAFGLTSFVHRGLRTA